MTEFTARDNWDDLVPVDAIASPRLDWDAIINPCLGRPMHWDRQGRPISLRRWCELTEAHTRKAFRRSKRVALTRIGRYEVSTVWLGLDHAFMPFGPPIIFETMVFERRTVPSAFGMSVHPSLDEFTDRYATEQGALRGHYATRRLVRRAMHEASGPPPLAVRYDGRRRQ